MYLTAHNLEVMRYGTWAEATKNPDMSGEYVALYDPERDEIVRVTLKDQEAKDDRPAPRTTTDVLLDGGIQQKAAKTVVRSGKRQGEAMDYIRNDFKMAVVGFRKAAGFKVPTSQSEKVAA